jgi:hypothetical protein
VTKDHDFKRLVRDRARQSGETYMQARDRLLTGGESDESSGRPQLVLVASGHVAVRRVAVPNGLGPSRLDQLGVDASRCRPAEALEISDNGIYMEIDHHIDLDVSADFDLDIDARGRVTVTGVHGAVTATSTGGHISLDGNIIDAHVETDDGRITIRGATGSCVAVTRNGHVDIEGAVTVADVETGDGHIRLDSVAAGSIYTANGRVEVGVGGPGTRILVEADVVNGDVTFTGRAGQWTADVGRAPASSLVVDASSRVTVHDRTR